MAQNKRAKWIEGITQSNRILRDITEIVCTAIKDESGVVKAENWELVYPRPFKETVSDRSQLLPDPSNELKYIPAYRRDEEARLIGVEPYKLLHDKIIESTLKVSELGGLAPATYVKDTDYTYDSVTNSIKRIVTGSIPDGAVIYVTYSTLYPKILDTMPVVVEKVLEVKDPDREILKTEYSIDYDLNQIIFNNEPPTDAEYFSLTFTERTGTYSGTEHTMLKLEKELLDPNGQTFKVPPSYGPIMQKADKRVIGQALTGGRNGTGEITYKLDPIAKTITFATAPALDAENGDALKFEGQMFTSDKASYNPINYDLAAEIDDPTKTIFNIVGAFNEINDGQPHSIVLHTANTDPILYKRLSDLNAGYETVDPDDYKVDYDEPSITFYEKPTTQMIASFTSRDENNITEGLNKIEDRIVLRTTTEPEYEFDEIIQNEYGAVDSDKELTMYVEIRKPQRLVNPETGLERYLDWKGQQQQTQENNHYINVRTFDQWDDEHQKPKDTIYGPDKKVVERGAYISDWSKYSWFQDWKEFLVDELDDDPGAANVADGILYQEVKTQGMTDEFPIQFWISTNNNRIALVLMGDPTLDQDNFLTSFAYIGRIHPFFEKECAVKRDEFGEIMLDIKNNPIMEEARTYFENDVKGNFGLTVGSSTLPSITGTPPKGIPFLEICAMGIDNADPLKPKPLQGNLYDNAVYSYIITYLTEVGESAPTPIRDGRIVAPAGTLDPLTLTPKQGIANKLRFRLPDEATGYRVYRYYQTSVATHGADSLRFENFKLILNVTSLDHNRVIDVLDNGIYSPMEQQVYDASLDATNAVLVPSSLNAFFAKFAVATSSARSFESVVRDKFTGAIIDVRFSTKYGKETATGVNDIQMFQTRSGLKYQKHNAAFITTEEFMRKEKSGQSRWTGKFHLSPVYIEHSYDKQRGWLDGVMVVDDSGIEHLDELIVDKDTPKEEVYKFFRLNAPYSFFNNSPNYAYGLAVIKSSMKWE